jgi:hypothetical protein
MPGVDRVWPSWPEFGHFKISKDNSEEDIDFRLAKDAIIKEYGEAALRESWLKTCAELSHITEEIALKGKDIIPIITMKNVDNKAVSEETVQQLKKRGCFVVRDVIDRDTANKIFTDLKEYTSINKGRYTGWPDDNPSIFTLFNTPSQNSARTHPNQLRLMHWINSLWHWSPSGADVSAEPLLYADAVRVRPAGSPFLGLGPHIDAGSLSRWGDPAYRGAYHAIFEGNPEQHDDFDLDARKNSIQDLFPGSAHSSVLRAFQGWTALTRTAPREGTILLYPNLKTAIAYVLLRPFFCPPEDKNKIMDARQWSFDAQSSWFPGTFKESSQLLSDTSHPHLRLKECLIHVPELQPGDTVWWHTDVRTSFLLYVLSLLQD